MYNDLIRFCRILRVLRTFARYDSLFLLGRTGISTSYINLLKIILAAPVKRGLTSKRPGDRLSIALTALGPAFIKLGQALSVRPDLLGAEIARDLRKLQDKVPAFDGKIAVAIVESELGKPINELFSFFDESATGAASVAQVHRAKTLEGIDVAVKILRPDVENEFARDLDITLKIAEYLQAWRPTLRRLKPVETVKTLIRSFEIEMDLRLEGAAAAEMKENFIGDRHFNIPDVDWHLTSRRILTTTWVEATSISELTPQQLTNIPAQRLVKKLAEIFFLQVFRDGFFHADLHPGNIFVDNCGNIHLVDFGIMGRLDVQTRVYLAEMLHGFLTANYKKVAEVHARAGFLPRRTSTAEFAQAVRSITEPIIGLPSSKISLSHLLNQLFSITKKFDMQTQPQLLLLQKTMLVAEGVGRKLSPEVNMWKLAEPLMENWAKQQIDAEEHVKQTTKTMYKSLERLPSTLRTIEDAIENWENKTNLEYQLKEHPTKYSSSLFWAISWLIFVIVIIYICLPL